MLTTILGAAASAARRERLVLAVDAGRTLLAGAAAALSGAGAPCEVLFALAARLAVGASVSNHPDARSSRSSSARRRS